MRLKDAQKLLTDIEGLKKSPWFNADYISDERRLGMKEALDMISSIIRNLPTADVAPVRHGRWKKAEPHGIWVYSDAYRQCSECNDVIYLGFRMKYCPTCGSKMDGEHEAD